jgi:hypothetical protein
MSQENAPGREGSDSGEDRRLGVARLDSAFLFFEANTFRIGTTQTAEVTVSVRSTSDPNKRIGVEVLTAQVIDPVVGDQAVGRRVEEVKCSADWSIDSDSNDAMKDFTVTALASSQGIGNLQSTVIFRYKEMR